MQQRLFPWQACWLICLCKFEEVENNSNDDCESKQSLFAMSLAQSFRDCCNPINTREGPLVDKQFWFDCRLLRSRARFRASQRMEKVRGTYSRGFMSSPSVCRANWLTFKWLVHIPEASNNIGGALKRVSLPAGPFVSISGWANNKNWERATC